MKMPKLYFQENKCAAIQDEYEYAKCVSIQVEALKTDRKVLKTIVEECTNGN
jgi:hypothetical protein